MLLYIDPGTGSMLIAIVIGLIGTIVYFVKNLMIKLKYFGFGNKNEIKEDKISLCFFTDHKRYWKVFKPILDELETRGQETIYLTQSSDDPVFDAGYHHITPKYIGEKAKAFALLNNFSANIMVSTTPSLGVYQWKRSKNIDYYVHIGHFANDLAMYKMFGLDYYDAVLVSGEYQEKQIKKLEELRCIHKKEFEYVGIPYLDEMKKQVDGCGVHNFSKQKTVLVAPSWGVNGLLMKYGNELIDSLINTGYFVIIRPHPQSLTSEKDMIDRLMNKYPDSDKLSWDLSNDSFDVLCKSDIMVSDFSGVLFEYVLVFDKPIVYLDYKYDKSQYDAAWLEEELWTFEILPYIGKKLAKEDLLNMKAVIDECIASDEYKEGREKARKETWVHQGEGTKRTVDYLERKLKELNSISEDAIVDGKVENDSL